MAFLAPIASAFGLIGGGGVTTDILLGGLAQTGGYLAGGAAGGIFSGGGAKAKTFNQLIVEESTQIAKDLGSEIPLPDLPKAPNTNITYLDYLKQTAPSLAGVISSLMTGLSDSEARSLYPNYFRENTYQGFAVDSANQQLRYSQITPTAQQKAPTEMPVKLSTVDFTVAARRKYITDYLTNAAGTRQNYSQGPNNLTREAYDKLVAERQQVEAAAYNLSPYSSESSLGSILSGFGMNYNVDEANKLGLDKQMTLAEFNNFYAASVYGTNELKVVKEFTEFSKDHTGVFTSTRSLVPQGATGQSTGATGKLGGAQEGYSAALDNYYNGLAEQQMRQQKEALDFNQSITNQWLRAQQRSYRR